MRTKISFSLLLLVVLCSCATYRKQPWTEAVYEKGNVYILDGVETLKTADLFTAHGTFEKSTWSVRREFRIYKYPDSNSVLSKIVQKNDNCDNSYYDYFAGDGTLTVCYENWDDSKIQNLTTRKSFSTGGLFANIRQAQCRYALVWDCNHDPERYFIFDKKTGKSTKLTSKALGFIGDQTNTRFFISPDGTQIFRCAMEKLSKETPLWTLKQEQFSCVVEVWDLNQEKTLMKSPAILISESAFDWPEVLYTQMTGDKLFVLFRDRPVDSNGSAIKTGCLIKEAIVTPNGYELKDLYSANEPLPNPNVIGDDFDNVTLFSSVVDKDYKLVERSWRLSQYNLNTGACLRQETIKLPDK